ncbi:RidA family protein [Lampropedia aestuarii]|uniref:RidA family protein n=1 Tax=Lampropedia aestuarii TaxID=2562762 RepID=A0A4S5BX10_9BURK|nr:RidA family protein [Lampropedia aestuarii]MDH5855863.1 RidA family protein [Lampropedia aestuarii]THJ35575.1 RidA family protein [Lampropedia aestuarii]
MGIYEKLQALNIELPPAAKPVAAYSMYSQTGNLIFLSGHIAKKDGAAWVGQLGKDLTTGEGKLAARAVGIDLLATLQSAAGGDLERIKRIVKVLSLVNSTPNYTEHHLVTNGVSEFLVEVMGDKGVHARSAFGVAQLPMGACVEIELIAELSD